MYIIKFPAPTRGFFAIFIEAVRCIDFAVSNGLPYYVDLSESDSLYTDTVNQNGDKNVWNYYFQQEKNVVNNETLIYSASKYEGNTNRIWLKSHFRRVYHRAVKNLQFAPDVSNTLYALKEKFPADTLGVHVRRTDHYIEVPQVPLQAYIKALEKKLSSQKFKNIFIATDDDFVLTELKNHFINYTVIHNNVTRSKTGEPVHKSGGKSDGFMLGMEALMDVYCLSMCKELIITNSNFSYCVLYFNPDVSYTLLNGFTVKPGKIQSLFFWVSNIFLNSRYLFFHKALLLKYYRRWKYFKIRHTSKTSASNS